MNKLSRTDAQAQGKRLKSVIPSAFPNATANEMRTEVVESLLRNCVDVAHASRTVTAVLESSPDPKNLIAEIRRCAASTLTPEVPPPGCDRCRRKDPYTGADEYTPHVPGEKNGYSCAVRCDCARGQWLAKRDHERQVEQPAPTARHEHPADADWARRAAGDNQ